MRLNATRLGSIASSRSFGDQLYDLAGERPNLDLNFAGTKTLDPRVTFTRASSATYTDSSGVLRSATTNLLLRSEEFDNASWTKNDGATVTANQIAAPNGTLTADQIVANGSATGYLEQAVSIVSGLTYTFSVYMKKRNTSNVNTLLYGSQFNSGGSNPVATWNLDTGSASFSNGATGSMISVGDGWYRCVMTDTATTTNASSLNQWIRLFGNSGDVYAWGAQLEQSSTVGDYVPTTSTINSAPRFDHNPTTGESLGLMVEEARTNSVTNNTMVGAVAGTPGTIPTGWLYATTSSNGLTQSIVGTGVENGINYIDFRYNGTTIASPNSCAIGIVNATAATAQTWTASTYWKLVGGTTTGVTGWQIGIIENTAGGSFLTGAFYAQTAPTSAALITQRPTATRTLSGGATVGLVTLPFNFAVAGSTAVDFTIRIGLPQLEQGAFATSVIPTTSATVTRAADVASITGSNFSSFYNQTEGTVFTEGAILNTGNNRFIADITDSGVTEEIALYWTTGFNSLVNDNGVNQANSFGGTVTANSRTLHSFGYKLNDFQGYGNGTALATDTSGTLPTVDRLTIGSRVNSTFSTNGTLKRLTYWPVRLANTTLQQITQP
jgi:hypothetical protein